MRMELADKNISFISICPGPVDTPFLHNIFTEKLTKSTKDTHPTRAGGDRVSAERCAELIMVAMVNKLDEVWIAKHPILLFVYATQYFPNLAKWWDWFAMLGESYIVHLRGYYNFYFGLGWENVLETSGWRQ